MTIRRVRELALCALVACGGARPVAKPPPPLDPAKIAAAMHDRMTEMAELTHRLRDACPTMASELRALFARMQLTVDDATRASNDPALAKQLTAELRRYDESDRDLSAAISGDLAACKDDGAVRDVMVTMPTLPP